MDMSRSRDSSAAREASAEQLFRAAGNLESVNWVFITTHDKIKVCTMPEIGWTVKTKRPIRVHAAGLHGVL